MSAVLEQLLTVDWSSVPPHVLQGLNTKTMSLSEAKGVVYWAAGSGKTGIVAHLPLRPVSSEQLATAEQVLQARQAVNAAQFAAVTTTVAAAAVVVAVVVVATTYLTGKIERVQSAVDELTQLAGQQDSRDYLKQVSKYIGAIQAGQELLNSNASEGEVAKLAVGPIGRLAELRQQVLAFIRGLQKSAPSDSRAMPFMIEMLDLIPAALAVERQLCFSAGLPALADDRRDQAAKQFRQELEAFRRWCEEQYRQLARGKDSHATTDPHLRNALRGLFNSPSHGILLGDWMTSAATQPPAAAGMRESGDEQLDATHFPARHRHA